MKTLLPTNADLLRPQPVRNTGETVRRRQTAQQATFNQNTKPLRPLGVGDVVRVKPYVKSDRVWKKGVVLEKLDARSYNIDVQGRI